VASTHFREASALYSSGHLDDADAALVKALRANPTHVKSLILKGVIHNARQRYDKAIEKFDMALRQQPQNGLAFGNRGIARRNKGLTRDALADFDRALDILGSDVSFLKQRAICHRILQQYHAALADYNLAISLAPNNAEMLYQRSRVYMRIDNHESRLADLVDALKIEPDNATYRSAFIEASAALDEPSAVSSVDLSPIDTHQQARRTSAPPTRSVGVSDSFNPFASSELVVVSPRSRTATANTATNLQPRATDPRAASPTIFYAKRVEMPSPRITVPADDSSSSEELSPAPAARQPVAAALPVRRLEASGGAASRASDGDSDRSLSRSGSARNNDIDPYNEPLPPLPIGENYPNTACNSTLGSLSPRTLAESNLTPRTHDSSEEYAHLPASSSTLGTATMEIIRSAATPVRKNKLVSVAADEAMSNAEYDVLTRAPPATQQPTASTLVSVKPIAVTSNDEYDKLIASESVRRTTSRPPTNAKASTLVGVQSLSPTTDDEYAVLIQKQSK
jgi:Flp pilus assembly protein TadD